MHHEAPVAYLVYVTCESVREAEKIATVVVAEHLAACVNILPETRSTYLWQGQVEQAGETILLAKTTVSGFPALERRILGLHSYECPCIVALPLLAGHAPFLHWLRESVDAR